jgi:hypothetical protein
MPQWGRYCYNTAKTKHIPCSSFFFVYCSSKWVIKYTPLWARRRERTKERKGMNEGKVEGTGDARDPTSQKGCQKDRWREAGRAKKGTAGETRMKARRTLGAKEAKETRRERRMPRKPRTLPVRKSSIPY